MAKKPIAGPKITLSHAEQEAARKTASEVVAKAAKKSAAEPAGPKLPAVYRDGTHSVIVFEMGPREVVFISMAKLDLERMRRHEFDELYSEFTDYPVRRAAEVYLGAAQYRPMPDQARELLDRIVADKATSPKTFVQTSQPKESIMPAKQQPAAVPARRVTDKPVAAKKAPAASKDEASTSKKTPPAPAKKVATPPVKAEKPTAKKAPWDKGEKPAAAAKGATAKTAATPPAAEPKKRSGRSSVDDTAKFKVGDVSSVKRGFIAEFVAKAQEFKKPFTRLDLEAHWGGRGADAKMGTYFPYCVDKGIFVAA